MIGEHKNMVEHKKRLHFFTEDLEEGEDDTYFEGDGESLMDQELMEEDGPVNTGDHSRTPDTFAIANVSCHYDGSPGNMSE